jgi:hypothetical protein
MAHIRAIIASAAPSGKFAESWPAEDAGSKTMVFGDHY